MESNEINYLHASSRMLERSVKSTSVVMSKRLRMDFAVWKEFLEREDCNGGRFTDQGGCER